MLGKWPIPNKLSEISAGREDSGSGESWFEPLRDTGEFYELGQDYTFPSPSTAASVIVGRNRTGSDSGQRF
jgi:hypothetical protein